MSEGLVFNMVGGGGGIKLSAIAVTTPPTKTSYLSGERFDPAGMVVTATYSNGAKLAATGYAVEPSGPLSDGMTSVTIRYTEGGRSVTTTQAVTVIPKLVSIAVITPPTKTAYRYGEAFSAAGMVVTATYTDGNSAAVTGYTTSPASFTSLGDQSVTVKYTENGVSVAVTTPVTVSRAVISTVPSQSGSLAYTGSALSPIWNNYNSAQLTLGGTTSATNAGTYTATFTPTSNYEWSDGTTTAKSVSWTIGKAAGSLSITPTSLTLDSSNPTGTINVTRAGNGTISAESSDTSVATVSVSGTQVTVNNVNQTSGSAVITISVSAGTNHTAPGSKTCEITAAFVSSVLNDNDWATIREVSSAGKGANYWAVGDMKAIVINGKVGNTTFSNLSINVFILGFNHNSAKEGSNLIHFQIGKINGTLVGLVDGNYGNNTSTTGAFTMNTSDTNSGGWNNSHMRKTVLGSNSASATSPTANTLLAALPADLRAVMKPVTKYSDNTGGGYDTASYVTSTTDYLFLLAEYEYHGAWTYANRAEQNYQAQYDYYKAGNSKIHYKHNATGTAAYAWCRSVYSDASSYFCLVSTDGSAIASGAGASRGVAPGFAA